MCVCVCRTEHVRNLYNVIEIRGVRIAASHRVVNKHIAGSDCRMTGWIGEWIRCEKGRRYEWISR